MKHVNYFRNFLDTTVNMPKAKLDLLSQRVDTVYGKLKDDDDLGPLIKKKIPQGSWPQKTIIRPQNGKAFDGDFMVQMVEKPEWEDDKQQYGDAIYRVLHNTSPYKNMPHGRKCRCVYLNYAENVMHLDIVPFILRDDGTQWIINRDNNSWERTDTDGFTAWMKSQDTIANKHLREVIRIMKFLRDHKNSFTGTKSILLTTLLGNQVKPWHQVTHPGYYADLPTALLHIVSDLDDWLWQNPAKPMILDPAGTGTSFDHRWTPETYAYFRARLHAHAAEIRAAYYETDSTSRSKSGRPCSATGSAPPRPLVPGASTARWVPVRDRPVPVACTFLAAPVEPTKSQRVAASGRGRSGVGHHLLPGRCRAYRPIPDRSLRRDADSSAATHPRPPPRRRGAAAQGLRGRPDYRRPDQSDAAERGSRSRPLCRLPACVARQPPLPLSGRAA